MLWLLLSWVVSIVIFSALDLYKNWILINVCTKFAAYEKPQAFITGESESDKTGSVEETVFTGEETLIHAFICLCSIILN